MLVINPAVTMGHTHTHTIYIDLYLNIEFDPFETSVQKSIKYLVLMVVLKSMHLVPIIYLPDFGHCDAKCSNIVLN
jgi:hypothetical protein